MSNSLLPPNATDYERDLEEATARISEVPIRVREVKNPNAAPSAILPWLAWEYSVDNWDDAWSAQQKREAIRQSVGVHRIKGTIGAVREALRALGYEVQVQEWFNQLPAGEPYTFRLLIDVNQNPIDQEALQKLLAVVNSTKNLRSHLDAVVPGLTSHVTLHALAATISGHETTLTANGMRYSDGEMAWGLMYDAAEYGEERTVGAIDALVHHMNEVMPIIWN